MGTDLVLDWPAAAAAGPEVCGGKGANLGRLQRYGFPVPAGGVLIAGVYRRFLETPELAGRCEELRSVAATDAALPGVVERLEDLRRRIARVELPADAARAIESFLERSGLADRRLAVRSSATAEDGAAASFAGVHGSQLDVLGPGDVLAAVRGCYASLWTPQALAYRRRVDLSDDDVACAVAICEMIGEGDGAPEAAGVAFSCDPRTGRRDLIVIDAVRGLADELVSGRATPDEFKIELRDGRLRILERPVDTTPVLGDERALELASLVARIHWALGEGQEPQDVEWVLAGGRFRVVQSRPVTRVPHVTFPGAAELPVIWSNSNLDEVLPGVPTTLTWNSIQSTLRDILYDSLAASGYPVPRMDVCRRFHGRLYFDLTALQWGLYDALGLPPADTNRTLGGHQAEIPVPPGNPYLARGGPGRLWRCLKFVRALRRAEKAFPGQMEKVHCMAREMSSRDLGTLSVSGLLECLDEVVDVTTVFFHRYNLGSASAGAWLSALEKTLDRVAPGEGARLAAALLAGSGGVTTAELGYRLFDLAETARGDAAAREVLLREPLDAAGWKELPEDSPFRRGFEEFLREYGHRGVYESELGHPTYREDPTYLLEQVRFLLSTGDRSSPREEAAKIRSRAEADVSRRTWIRRPLVRWLAAWARRGAAFREAGRSAVVHAGSCSRRVALDVGRRLVDSGKLERPEDVFDFSWPDLHAFLHEEWDGTGARALVEDRRARRDAWRAEKAPSFLVRDGEGRPAEMPRSFDAKRPAPGPQPDAEAAGKGDGRVLRGIAAAPGRVSGIARVIAHPTEGGRLRTGDILVTGSTDPGWTPLFLRAGGVVTEVGGHLSHAAIVAREFGVPAVLNVPGLLETVVDGEVLDVDGDTGRVRILERTTTATE